MKILAFDCATDYVALALQDDTVVMSRTWRVGRDHSRRLTEAIESGLADCDLDVSSLDAIAVGLGPGSYTGVRIALSAAKGLALGLGRPLVGISSLETLAYGCGAWSGPICAAIPTGIGAVGLGEFRGPWSSWRRLHPERALSRSIVGEYVPDGSLVCGPAADALTVPGTERAPRQLDVPQAHYLAALAQVHLEQGGADQLYTAQPLYLRPSAAEERWAESSGGQ